MTIHSQFGELDVHLPYRTCRFCRGQVAVLTNPDGTYFAAHVEPRCSQFDSMSAEDFWTAQGGKE